MAVDRRGSWWHTILTLPLRYCITVGVMVVPILATLLARWALGDDPTQAEMDDLGYGLPALEDGRWWTPFTGAVIGKDLAIPLPSFTTVTVFLYERVAGHWRPLVALVGGQVLGVVIVLLLIIPLQDVDSTFAQEVTNAIDFGISVGGFACLGAWTAYLRARTRRPVRWAGSCYQIGPLLFSGLIYDLTHPAGWILGVLAGPVLMRPATPDPTPMARRELPWIGGAIVFGLAVGTYAGWNGGGIGGIFGWGP